MTVITERVDGVSRYLSRVFLCNRLSLFIRKSLNIQFNKE